MGEEGSILLEALGRRGVRFRVVATGVRDGVR